MVDGLNVGDGLGRGVGGMLKVGWTESVGLGVGLTVAPLDTVTSSRATSP